MTDTPTTVRDLAAVAGSLGAGWRGRELGRIEGVGLKLFCVDPAGLALDSHAAWDEALLMLAGQMVLTFAGSEIRLSAGDFQLIPAGTPHAILPGGHGSYLLFDPEPPRR